RPEASAQEEVRAWERALVGAVGDVWVFQAAEDKGVLAGLARGRSALRGAGDEEDGKSSEGGGIQSWLHIGFLPGFASNHPAIYSSRRSKANSVLIVLRP